MPAQQPFQVRGATLLVDELNNAIARNAAMLPYLSGDRAAQVAGDLAALRAQLRTVLP